MVGETTIKSGMPDKDDESSVSSSGRFSLKEIALRMRVGVANREEEAKKDRRKLDTVASVSKSRFSFKGAKATLDDEVDVSVSNPSRKPGYSYTPPPKSKYSASRSSTRTPRSIGENLSIDVSRSLSRAQSCIESPANDTNRSTLSRAPSGIENPDDDASRSTSRVDLSSLRPRGSYLDSPSAQIYHQEKVRAAEQALNSLKSQLNTTRPPTTTKATMEGRRYRYTPRREKSPDDKQYLDSTCPSKELTAHPTPSVDCSSTTMSKDDQCSLFSAASSLKDPQKERELRLAAEDKIAKLYVKISELDHKLATAEENCRNERQAKQEVQAKVAKLENCERKLASQLKQCKKGKSEAEEKMVKVIERMSYMDQALASTEEKLRTALKVHKRDNEAKALSTVEVKELKGKLKVAEKKLSRSQKELSAMQDQNESNTKCIEMMRVLVEEKEKEINSRSNSRVKEWASKEEAFRQELIQVQKKFEQHTAQLQQRVQEKENQIKVLKDEQKTQQKSLTTNAMQNKYLLSSLEKAREQCKKEFSQRMEAESELRTARAKCEVALKKKSREGTIATSSVTSWTYSSGDSDSHEAERGQPTPQAPSTSNIDSGVGAAEKKEKKQTNKIPEPGKEHGGLGTGKLGTELECHTKQKHAAKVVTKLGNMSETTNTESLKVDVTLSTLNSEASSKRNSEDTAEAATAATGAPQCTEQAQSYEAESNPPNDTLVGMRADVTNMLVDSAKDTDLRATIAPSSMGSLEEGRAASGVVVAKSDPNNRNLRAEIETPKQSSLKVDDRVKWSLAKTAQELETLTSAQSGFSSQGTKKEEPEPVQRECSAASSDQAGDTTDLEKEESILAKVPIHIKDLYQKVGFFKDRKLNEYFPVLCLRPFSMPPGPSRDQVLREPSEFVAVYIYGKSSIDAAYQSIKWFRLIPYVTALKKGLNRVPEHIEAKLENKIPLSRWESELYAGLEQVKLEAAKESSDRMHPFLQSQTGGGDDKSESGDSSGDSSVALNREPFSFKALEAKLKQQQREIKEPLHNEKAGRSTPLALEVEKGINNALGPTLLVPTVATPHMKSSPKRSDDSELSKHLLEQQPKAIVSSVKESNKSFEQPIEKHLLVASSEQKKDEHELAIHALQECLRSLADCSTFTGDEEPNQGNQQSESLAKAESAANGIIIATKPSTDSGLGDMENFSKTRENFSAMLHQFGTNTTPSASKVEKKKKKKSPAKTPKKSPDRDIPKYVVANVDADGVSEMGSRAGFASPAPIPEEDSDKLIFMLQQILGDEDQDDDTQNEKHQSILSHQSSEILDTSDYPSDEFMKAPKLRR